MADKRMFSKQIVRSDAFLDMPLTTQALYFQLCMEADDDGFVGNPKGIKRYCGASDDDLKLLLTKRFLLGFDSGVVVVKHFKINNSIRQDRHKKTTYIEELQQLTLDQKGAYTEATTKWQPNGNQVVDNLSPQSSLDKIRLDKIRLDQSVYNSIFNILSDEDVNYIYEHTIMTNDLIDVIDEKIGLGLIDLNKITYPLAYVMEVAKEKGYAKV